MSIPVTLKHGKLAHDTTVEPADTGATFKGRVYQLTGVPADRQKVMTKRSWKGPLKDDAVMASMTIKSGQKFMLTGTSTGIPSAPDAAVVFVEDMTDAQKAATVEVLKSGLVNMGNTCYLNATLQCLRFVPELRSSLASFADTRATGGDANGALAMALSRLFDKLDASVDPVLPSTFVPLLRSFVPTPFAERTAGGHFKQQDADSFLNHIMAHVLGALPEEKARELFGVRLATTLKCLETDDEPNVDQMEHNMKLRCNIMGGGGSTTKIDFMRDGIKLALAPDGGEQIEKSSAVLGRNAAWQRESKVDSLPKYLCVQFVRFDSKRHRTTGGDVEVRSCKVLRAVTFPVVFDAFEFCTDRLKAELTPFRDADMDKDLPPVVPAKEGAAAEADSGEAAAADDADAALQAALAMSMEVEDVESDAAASAAASATATAAAGLPLPTADFRGQYELFSIVTHKGRSANGGHYIGWAKKAKFSDQWYKFDDDTVDLVKEGEVKALKGGGDRDSAYLAFYRYIEGPMR